MSKDTYKATFALKADSIRMMTDALDAIAIKSNIVIVINATISTSISIEADDIDDLREALSDVTGAIEESEGVECKVSAPGSAWHGRRLDPTPMERMINKAFDA
jgi:hypothetical protein